MSRFGARSLAVVGRAFLVAERLEAILQVLVELLVELVRLELERFLVRAVAAADDALAQGEEELPQTFLPPLRLDELEGGVSQVVRQPAVGELDALKIAHRRDDVGDGGVPDRHQVERIPVTGFEIRKSFIHPQGQAAAQQRPRNDVEFEDVRELVSDQPVERVGRLVDRQHHAIAIRLGEREHALGQLARIDVLLLEFAFGLVEDERNFEGEVVLEIGAHLLIRALRVAGDPFEMLLDVGVVVDLEVIRRVDAPLEVVVLDAVLVVVRHERRLRAGGDRAGDNRRTQRRRCRAALKDRARCACAWFTSSGADVTVAKTFVAMLRSRQTVPLARDASDVPAR